MAELKSMKIDPKEREKRYKETVAVDAPQYPYGLSLHLDDECMAKLGMSTLPQVGKQVMVYALANVTSVSENDSESGGKRQSVSLQITDLCLEKPPAKESDAGKALYGE